MATPEQSRVLFSAASMLANADSEVLPVGPSKSFAGAITYATTGSPVGTFRIYVGMTPTALNLRADGDAEFTSITTGTETVVTFDFVDLGFPYVQVRYARTSGGAAGALNGIASVP